MATERVPRTNDEVRQPMPRFFRGWNLFDCSDWPSHFEEREPAGKRANASEDILVIYDGNRDIPFFSVIDGEQALITDDRTC